MQDHMIDLPSLPSPPLPSPPLPSPPLPSPPLPSPPLPSPPLPSPPLPSPPLPSPPLPSPPLPSPPLPSPPQVLCSVCSPMSSLRALASQAQGPKLQFPALPPGWEKKYKPGEMYRHQNSIPKLPVPPLQQTLQKYLIAVKVGTL